MSRIVRRKEQTLKIRLFYCYFKDFLPALREWYINFPCSTCIQEVAAESAENDSDQEEVEC